MSSNERDPEGSDGLRVQTAASDWQWRERCWQRGCRLSARGRRQPQSVHGNILGAKKEMFPLCRNEARDRQAARSWVAETVGWSGRIDVLVITPASRHSLASRTEGAALDDLSEVNVKAPFRVIQAALPISKHQGGAGW